ncbi:MAG: MBL fold metallo-hydrolase [Myxococcaceae bacterium]|nr:MAG: MBL fold metallo-hydrolase [Myxococcaceae bacterium]
MTRSAAPEAAPMLVADLRLAPAAALAWGCALLVTALPALSGMVCIAAWTGTLAVCLALIRRPARGWPGRGAGVVARWWRVAPSLAVALAGVALVSTACFGLGHLRHPPALDQGRPLSGAAELTVTGMPRVTAGGFAPDVAGGAPAPQRVMVEATLDTFETRSSSVAARAPALVFLTIDHPETLRIGARFRTSGSLTALPPGDSREFLLFARGAPEFIGDPPWLLGWADAVRAAFRATTYELPGDGAELLTGLAIGDDSGVADDLKDAMIVAGLTHLTAVSGANCAVIVAAVMLVGGALGLGRRTRIAVSIVVLALFVVLVTPEPSVLRAATMAVIVLVALALGRPGAGVPPLCLSVAVLLALDPWLARSAGFALSVLATAGLLLLTRPIARCAAGIMPRWLALALAVPVAAQLACQPVLFLLAPQLTPYTIPANVLAEPAAAVVSVLGMVVCLLAVLVPPLAALVAWLPWVASSWIAAVARFFAGAPFSVVDLNDSAVAAIGAVIVTTLLLIGLFAHRTHPLLGRSAAAAAAVIVLLIAAVLSGGAIARVAAVPGDWQLAACDIGQGDAVLVRSHGQIALVDVGPDPEPLSDCLKQLGIDRIDLLVLTHYDRDHVGGIDAALGRVDRALVGPTDGAGDQRLLERLRDGGAEVAEGRRGLSGALGDYRWDVLWPRDGDRITGNDASVTVLFTGPLRMLFLGDLGEQGQSALESANRIATVDVVKVAHHGSADQSENLYRDIRAVVGVISVGAGNSYGHPTDRLLAILARVGTRAFRTDQDGLVLVSGTAGAISIWTEKGVPP